MINWDDIEKDDKLPQKIMEYKYNVIHNRNWKNYLNSIEWDGEWLRHDTEEEKKLKQIEKNFNSHPFKKWIEKKSLV